MLTEIIACLARRGRLLKLGLGLFVLGLVFAPAWTAGKDTAKDKAPAAKSKAKSKAKAKTKNKASSEAVAKVPFAPGHSLLIFGGLHCQVHQQGQVRQDLTAQTGRYDDAAKVMDLERMHARFMAAEGTTVTAEVRCGAGRVWTADRPDEGIATHDMLLQQSVRLRTGENVQLQSPEMRYHAAAGVLQTDKGFVEQIPAATGFLIGKGQRFEIKLNLADNQFETIKQYGTTSALTELRKNEKAVLIP